MTGYTDEDRAIGWEVICQLGEPADPVQLSYERLIATAAAAHAREIYAVIPSGKLCACASPSHGNFPDREPEEPNP